MRHWISFLLVLGLAGNAMADDGTDNESPFTANDQLGARHHQLDGYTRLTGWQLSRQWYFGRQRGEDSALGFVWQRDADQMSISTDGIRFTRRF